MSVFEMTYITNFSMIFFSMNILNYFHFWNDLFDSFLKKRYLTPVLKWSSGLTAKITGFTEYDPIVRYALAKRNSFQSNILKVFLKEVLKKCPDWALYKQFTKAAFDLLLYKYIIYYNLTHSDFLKHFED